MGCCLALELARRGRKVDLIDRASTAMTGASLHNEGKLHLGFVYANDPFKGTHGLMTRGSMAFGRIIERLTGINAGDLPTSHPFHYFVPVDSQLSMSRIHDHFCDIGNTIRTANKETGDLYLGSMPDCPFEQNSPRDHARLFSPKMTLGSFRTCELSVSPLAVAGILVRAVRGHPNVNFLGDTEILSAARLSGGDVEVEVRRGKWHSKYRYACVANCLWDDKLRVDRTAGIVDDGPWLLRYKATIAIETASPAPESIPSATGILGPYGDVVNQDNESYYVSWYPRCRIAETADGDGRGLHDLVHTGMASRVLRRILPERPSVRRFVSSHAHRRFVRENLVDMAAFVPSIAHLLDNAKTWTVGGGVIVARGATDIDDPKSLLHRRSAVGPAAYGSYITVDTGKYCTAPMFALDAADMVTRVL
jgi:glycine/D-amino acid oxidase-like deaminating enzyme